MTRRRWILPGVVLAVVLTPVGFYYGVQNWTRYRILEPAKPAPDESLPTDDPLTELTKKARLAERARDYQTAADLYTRALEDGPRPAAIRRNLLRQRAFAYEDLRRYDRAEADYNSALQIEPIDPDFYAKRGFYFTRRGRYDDALADFRRGSASTKRRSSALPRQFAATPRSRPTTGSAAALTIILESTTKP
jgi:tetratricopeptide (TPR) repeat protein